MMDIMVAGQVALAVLRVFWLLSQVALAAVRVLISSLTG